MRHARPARRLIAALALLWAAPSAAIEVEEERFFPAPGAAAAEMTVISTTDLEVFAPIVEAFQAARPGVAVRYVVASSTELHGAVEAGAAFDLAISSAMDLQMKLANDGHARAVPGPAAWPVWARWRDELWAIAQEPVVVALAPGAFGGAPPETRSGLVEALRADPGLRARVGTYDPRRSGAGYLFATQDARRSDTSWRLAEVMGALEPRLYASTGAMLADLAAGRIDLAYNVVGSYAAAAGLEVVEPRDFTHVLLRTALVPRTAPSPDLGAAMLAFLLSPAGQAALEAAGLPPVDEAALARAPHRRPIRLDPGLLAYVDPLKRARFLREWTAAVRQP